MAQEGPKMTNAGSKKAHDAARGVLALDFLEVANLAPFTKSSARGLGGHFGSPKWPQMAPWWSRKAPRKPEEALRWPMFG